MIEPKYVTFEQAKLLKEKGFDNVQCTGYYFGTDDCIPITSDKQHKTQDKCLAPEQHQVVDWLLEKHNIWITVTSVSQESWQWHITKPGDSLGKLYEEDFYNPKEAYSAAIDYILLNNII